MALSFEARKVALKQDRTGFILTLAMHPDEVPEEILRDFVGARYAVAIQRIADDESAVPYNNRVKTAGMICRDLDFQQFLVASNWTNEEGENAAFSSPIRAMSSRTTELSLLNYRVSARVSLRVNPAHS